MFKPAACLAFVMWAASPAVACTGAQLQLVANRFFALNKPGAASAPIAEALRHDLVTCANEPAHQGSVWPTLPSLRQG